MIVLPIPPIIPVDWGWGMVLGCWVGWGLEAVYELLGGGDLDPPPLDPPRDPPLGILYVK